MYTKAQIILIDISFMIRLHLPFYSDNWDSTEFFIYSLHEMQKNEFKAVYFIESY